jgi:diacylglycerol O-acyltransferase / wax synthase
MSQDRLSGLDSSFLHLERGGAHMHVASVIVFEGPVPAYDEFAEHVGRRLHLVPRYRQKIRFVPLQQGRPVWVDDPHFSLAYHVRHTALPPPGDEEQLKRLASRVFSQQLDRSKPLWETWLVDGLADGRFALLAKTHHALVDGVSGVDIATVLFDTAREPEVPPTPAQPWLPQPEPSDAELLARALLERTTRPREIARGVRALFRGPREVAGRVARAATDLGGFAWTGLRPAPDSPFNVQIGPHRRFTWVPADLGRFKEIKNELGGTVNDVVLAAVAGALRRHLQARGHSTQELELRAMVPVSVRAETERGALGNRVASMMAPLPLWCGDPVERLRIVSAAMQKLKSSGQAVGAERLTQLADFAPPTILTQAARLQARSRPFNLVVTNVPGPQFPLYALGREMEALYPMVPLAQGQALGIAIMSYNGQLNFGLIADYDAMPSLEDFAEDLRVSMEELGESAGLPPAKKRKRVSRAAKAEATRA